MAPVGYNASRVFDETRFQQLIPARYLPSTGATIHGIEFLGIGLTTTVNYDLLRVRLSHANLVALDVQLDANLIAPKTTFDQAPSKLELKLDEWSPLTFETPFVYDGTSDLVIEIQKAITLDARVAFEPIVGTRVAGNPGRSDLPTPRYAAGPHGSGAAFAPRGTRTIPTPLVMQLVVSEPSLTVRSDRGGRNGNAFAISDSLSFDVHAKAGTFFALLGYGALLPPVATPPIDGLGYVPLIGNWQIGNNVIGFDGAPATISLAIPDRADLVGFRPGFQAVLLDLTAGQLAWTSAVDFVVQD